MQALHIGFITGLEANHKQIEKADTGLEVCCKIEPIPGEAPKLYGRHFTHEDVLVRCFIHPCRFGTKTVSDSRSALVKEAQRLSSLAVFSESVFGMSKA